MSEEQTPKTPPAEGRAELPAWNRSRRKKRRSQEKAEAQDDAFQKSVREASGQLWTHPKTVVTAVLVGLVGLAVVLFVRERGVEQANSSTRTLETVVAAEARGVLKTDMPEGAPPPPAPVFDSAEARETAVKQALEGLDEADSDKVGELGGLIRGARALREGAYEEAVKHYDSFLAEASDSHSLRFMAVEGRGFALEASGDLEGALAAHQSISGRTGAFYRDQAMWNEGRLLEALGRADEATDVYKRYLQEFPKEGSFARSEVRDRLKELAPEALNAAAEAGVEKPAEGPEQE